MRVGYLQGSPSTNVSPSFCGGGSRRKGAAALRAQALRGHPLGTTQALDALARPGTTACSVCDAAEALLPILAHGQNDVPAPSD
ncbi:DUF6233 domain-containing protein [Streptomyces sp. NPDC059496]|uniref:DUF6233 domain-containing protein n=1 Tax=Streptomyces sp. NPDC059496 TaxID=3346851 RepID=UPI0036B91599